MKEKKSFLKWADGHFEELLLVILLVIIAVISMLQVIIRNIPWVPTLKWAEEFCRFAWIWSVFLSLPYTIKNNSMLRVAVLLDLLPQAARKVINMIIDLVTAGSMGFLGWYSVSLLKNIYTSMELSPAMTWPMWTIYLILPVGFFLGAFRAVQMLVHHITHFSEAELTTKEQAEADAAAEAAAGKKAEGGEA